MAKPIRSLDNPSRLTDLTTEINEQDNQFGVFNAMGLFNVESVSQETITFEKNIKNVTLIPQTTRRGGQASRGVNREYEVYNLNVPYFEHKDFIGVQDIQGYRGNSLDGQAESLAVASAKKVMDMRESADQTREYMQIEAIKGLTKDAYGVVIADMFKEFGLDTRRNDEISAEGFSLDFDLGNAATKVYDKVDELKRYVGKKAATGASIGRIEVPCSESFFDALKNHESVQEAYAMWSNRGGQNGGKEIYRESLSIFANWGVYSTFEINGVLFWTYPAEFSVDQGDGTYDTVTAFTGKEGYTIVHGVKDAYRGAFGPRNTLSGANVGGSELYMSEYRDVYDKSIEFTLEMSPLYWLARPQLSIRCHTTT